MLEVEPLRRDDDERVVAVLGRAGLEDVEAYVAPVPVVVTVDDRADVMTA